MATDRSETAVGLLVLPGLFGALVAEPVPDDRLWIVLPVVVLFGASVFLLGVQYGVHRGRQT